MGFGLSVPELILTTCSTIAQGYIDVGGGSWKMYVCKICMYVMYEYEYVRMGRNVCTFYCISTHIRGCEVSSSQRK